MRLQREGGGEGRKESGSEERGSVLSDCDRRAAKHGQLRGGRQESGILPSWAAGWQRCGTKVARHAGARPTLTDIRFLGRGCEFVHLSNGMGSPAQEL